MSNLPQNVKEGTWSVAGDKLRITYSDGVESVLFEDTASISFQSIVPPDNSLQTKGFLVFAILMSALSLKVLVVNQDFLNGILIGIIAGAMYYFSTAKPLPPWDEVSIETVGGKVVKFRCAYGFGAATMERIEAAKRNWQNS